MSTKLSAYSTGVDSLEKQARQLQERMLRIHEAKPLLDQISAKLEAANITQSQVSVFAYDVVSVHVYIVGLDSFKDQRLAELLDMFADADGVATADFAEHLVRSYRFQYRDGCGNEVVVLVAASVNADSTTCRKVVCGTETVQKWQIVCE